MRETSLQKAAKDFADRHAATEATHILMVDFYLAGAREALELAIETLQRMPFGSTRTDYIEVLRQYAKGEQ